MKIETDRLIIRKYTRDDAHFIYKLMNSEGWLKNIGNRNINSIQDAETYLLKNYIPSYKNQGFGPYLVTLKDGSEIGSSGLYQRENLDHPDIGFAFLPEYFNKGYAFEAAHAIMKYASEDLGVHKIVGFTLPENASSIKLLKKLGLSEVGTYSYGDDEELLLFSN
ncbi:GNAT family N-acetyltransferase [Aequorivita capsosiphonis]|uniref:GNAT family N-acetyltransferase n=1 Tax=Aequorivita capsosiphonis TaxID=487317 RepID=UPI00047975F9|nr:GNAT family N-acetyltransferase [Aequorivita capsosiphonis]